MKIIEYILPSLIGIIAVIIQRNGKEEILIFLYFSILTQIIFELNNKKNKEKKEIKKEIFKKSELRKILKQLKKINK